MTLNMSDVELKLQIGLPIDINGICTYYSPTLSQIISLGHEQYSKMISSVMFDKEMIENEEVENLSNFQILMSLAYTKHEIGESFFDCLRFLLHEDQVSIHEELGIVYFGEFTDYKFLTEKEFELIKQIVKLENNIVSEKEQYNPANTKAQELVDRLKKARKRKPKTKEKITLRSIISGVAWKAPNQNIQTIKELTVFQLWDGYFRLQTIDQYDQTMQGVVTGNVDGKKINLSDINWANVINFNN